MLGQTISHYRITHRLGSGGMGVVYKADDLTLERTVALKFLPQDLAVSPTDKENLLREARSASALDHPNIGVIHGLEESEDHQLFIVMGYYEGETLTQKINRGVVSVRDSLDYAIQIARGLSAAHARNIVHRDIKPSNIIITTGNITKIVDFGLARAVSSASATQSVSNTGTLPYMAPEQILGESIDQRVDVWALGVIIVQMLTGSHPFLRPNSSAMTFAILNQAPTAVDAVPAPVQPIVYRALSKQASHRYPSADEMARDLEIAQTQITSTPLPQDAPTITRTLSPKEIKRYIEHASTPRWKSQSRGSRLILMAATALLLLAGGVLSFPRVRASLFESPYAGTEKHIVVLPFDTDDNDPEFQALSNGLMNSVTNRLSNLSAAQQSLWVVPASVVRSNHVADPAAARRTLGATIVVEGGLRRRGQQLVLTLNLVDAKRVRQIGSEEIESRNEDLAALEDDAIFKLARLLKTTVPDSELAESAGVSHSTYESYVKALGYLERYDKPGNLDRAIEILDSATKRDPRFALGFATLAEAIRLKFHETNHLPYLSEATRYVQKAIELNDHLPAAHATLGEINLSLGKTDPAVQEFQRALELAPRDADTALGLAYTYQYMDRFEEAESTFKRAIALRPDYWVSYTGFAFFCYHQNRLPEAITLFKRVIELTPDNAEGYSNLGMAYLAVGGSGSDKLAESALRKSVEVAPNYAAYTNLSILYLNQQRYPEAVREARRALDYNDKDWVAWDNLLVAYLWVGDDTNIGPTRAKTLSLLEQALVLSPKHPSVQSRLSTFYAEDKKPDKAIALAATAVALGPKDSLVLTDLTETFEALGDHKKARQYAKASFENGGLSDLKRRPSLKTLVANADFQAKGKM
jgi:eukaryotic-like serine/threonine-protein kinase